MSTHGFRVAAVAVVLVGLGLLAAVAQAFSPVGQPGSPGFALPVKDAQMLAVVESCFPGDQERDQNQANDQTRDNLQSRDRDHDCLPGDCLPGVELDCDRVRLQAQDQRQDANCGSGPAEASQLRERAQGQERVVSDQGPKQDETDLKQARSQGPLHQQVQERVQAQIHVSDSTAVTAREQRQIERPLNGQAQEQNRVTTETQAELREQQCTETQAQVGEPEGKGKR